MTRTEMYDFIKANCLKDEVRRVFGVNYSSVSNDDLEDFIDDFNSNTTCSTKTAVTYNIVDEYKAAVVVMLTYLKSVGKLDEVLKLVNK